jgi:glycosyltransferase involved in cell wall biosynthesis
VIVIDNGSTDTSAQVAVEYGAELLKAPGLKVGAVRNRGVAVAEDAEIIAFVDSDHELPTDWLTQGVARLLERSDAVAAGAFCLAPPQGTWVQTTWALHRLRRRYFGEAAWLGAGNLFVRREDFQAIGGFNESLTASEDVDLCERLRRDRGVILFDPAIRNIHHGEPPTLWQFFKKELWRGKSGLRGFFAHGMPWHEWPSLAFPAWHFFFLIAIITSLIALGWNASPYWLLGSVIALFLPSFLLALKTAQQQRAWTHIPHLAVLYFTYALARVASFFSW